MAADEALKGQVLGLCDDIADKAAADQQATDQVAIDNLQVALDSTQAQLADALARVAELEKELEDQNPPPPPPPPPATVVLGASLGQPLPVSQVLPAVRLYSPSKVANLPPGTTVVVLSDKSTSPTATVNAVKAHPDVEFYCTFHHEPDDDIKNGGLSVASWGSAMNAYGKALAGLPNAHFGPIHNGSFGKTGWVADEASCDKGLWSFFGMDRYSLSYEDPATQFAEGSAYAASLGLPLLIGECGAPRSDAVKQKTVASQIRAWALNPANNAAVICWWQASNSQHDTTFANADVQHAFLG